MILRPYQVALIDAVCAAIERGDGAILMQAPTGAGKTAMAAELFRRVVAAGHRAVFCAHLDTLLDDTATRLRLEGIPCGIVQANRPRDPSAPVQVVSTQTMAMRDGEAPPADLFFLDEAHRSESPSMQAIHARYHEAVLVGATATPSRGDGRGLGDTYRTLCTGPSIRELQASGYIVPIDLVAPLGDTQGRLAKDPASLFAGPLDPLLPAIVFAETIHHADVLRAGYEARGITAELFVGDTSRADREELRQNLRAGRVQILISVAALVEGFDEPSIRTVVLARSFGVIVGYLQAIGRGSRPAPATGKTRCTVFDLKGAWQVHGLPDEDRAWSLKGASSRRSETIPSLQRCPECFAVFRPQASCPRCACELRTAKVERLPRVMTRAERLANISHLSQSERDARYLGRMIEVAGRLRKTGTAGRAWAIRKFVERFGRLPQLEESTNG